MKPIKVLHITNVDKENYYLNNLCDYSDSSHVEYSFVTLAPYCEFAEALEKRGKRVYCLDALKRKSYPSAMIEIGKILKKEDPQIVHTHLFDPSLLALTVAKWQKRRTVYTRHHSDALHELRPPLKRRFYLALENYTSKKADHIIAPSQMVRDYLVEREEVPDKKVSIIPYGQTTERFDAITPTQIAAIRSELNMDGRLALVNVSRLFHRKGHTYLFEAFAKLLKDGIEADLYLVGDGDYRAELEKMCAKLSISEHTKFLGWRADALAIVAASDVVVHPSLEDALSSAVIEAVMLEKPIIATDISGVRDSLDNGKYGKIVPPADPESLLKATKDTLEDLGTARDKAKNGRLYLLGYMGAKRVSDAYSDVYKNLVVRK